MKSKILFSLVVVALLSAMLTSAYGTAPNSFDNVQASGMDYAIEFDAEGQMWRPPDGYSTLGFLEDRDHFTLRLHTPLKITIIIADCCLQGDTIAVFYPTPVNRRFVAVSPNIIMGSKTLPAGTYEFWVGYTDAPGGFPAGYYMWLIATAP